VTRKLRAKGSSATTEMEPALLAEVVGTLFPPREEVVATVERFREATRTAGWVADWEVSEEELLEATRRMASREVAPGPDGIPGRIWGEAMEVMAPRLRRLFSRRMKEGV
jgi:hypothetical protein